MFANGMKRLIYIGALFFVSLANGQTGSVQGIVKDKNSNLPIIGISVVASSFQITDITNELGKFNIPALPEGSAELTFSSIGYKTVTVPVEIKSGEISSIQVAMEVTLVDLAAVVVSGKKISPLNTIAAVDIRLRPVNTSQDILRIVPGLFIAQHAGGGKAEQLFLRGYDIDHGTDVSVSVDGMPVNMVSHAHGQGYADLHFLIPELIDRVNFDKGPYNNTKGNFATAGWIDFTTKDFLAENSAKLEYGTYNYKRVVGLFKIADRQENEKRRQFYIGSEYFKNDGYFDAPQDFHRFNLFGKYTATGNDSKLQITASMFDSKWNASGQIPDRAVLSRAISRFGSVDNSEGGYTSRMNLNGKWIKHWKNGLSSHQQAYFSNYHFNLFSNFTFYLNDAVNGDAIQQKENRNLFGYNGALIKTFNYKHLNVMCN